MLLVGGLLGLRQAMPSMVSIGAGAAVLLWLISFRGDGDASVGADSDADWRIVTIAAMVLAGSALVTQGWAALRREGARPGCALSAGMWVAGVAMLTLFAAIILARLTEVA